VTELFGMLVTLYCIWAAVVVFTILVILITVRRKR
jgi:hypothetical protein